MRTTPLLGTIQHPYYCFPLLLFNVSKYNSYAARLFGTFVGLVIGLVAWYAGNGHGNGNPYGSAAATAVVLVPILFARINAPLTSLVPVMMCSVSFSALTHLKEENIEYALFQRRLSF